MMRLLVLVLCFVLAVESLRWPVSFLAHVALIAPVAVMSWYIEVTRRPLRPCKHCDKGRNWDNSHTRFGEFCGWCGARGKKLTPAAWFLRAIGLGHQLRNLPEDMKGSRDE